MEAETEQVSWTGEQLQLVTFKLGEEDFGVNILSVQEINKVADIRAVPNAPNFVEGIINLRGKVIPVIDLRKRFGLDVKPTDQRTRIIVADVAGKTIGFRVDAVNEVLRISSDSLEVPPEIVSGPHSNFFKSVVKIEDKLLILVSLDKIFTNTEQPEFAAAV